MYFSYSSDGTFVAVNFYLEVKQQLDIF